MLEINLILLLTFFMIYFFLNHKFRINNAKNLSTLARVPLLKLEPAFSRVKPGGTTEVECISSPDAEVIWYRDNGESIPSNFMVILFNFSLFLK